METQPNRLKIWLLAARPKTLPAATAPVLVGVGVAVGEGVFRLIPALCALVAALLLQIGSNLANDVFDFKRGADATGRLGPLRVTQAGLLSPRQVQAGMWAVFCLAALIGVYLVAVSGWPILLVGVLAIAAAVAYTGGPFPLGYHGLGELFVFLFFGLAAVGGTYYVQAATVSTTTWWAAVPMGFLSSAILVVNNLRDIEADRAAGKRTLAVRLGARCTRVEYALLLLLAFLMPPWMWLVHNLGPGVMLAWLALPLAFRNLDLVLHRQGSILNTALAGTAQTELFFACGFALGLALPAWL